MTDLLSLDATALLAAFAARRPAPSADAAGGVKALAAASDAAIDELVAWVDATR